MSREIVLRFQHIKNFVGRIWSRFLGNINIII